MGERERALEKRGEKTHLARHQARRAFQLSVAVGGTGGGLILLGSNIAVALHAGIIPASPVPFVANLALVFGGAMFAREFRRAGSVPRDEG